MKEKGLFFIHLILLIYIFSNIYFYIYELFISPPTNEYLYFLPFILIVLPITVLLSDKITKVTLDKDIQRKKSYKFFMSGAIIISLAFNVYLLIDDNRVKNVDELIKYEAFNDFSFQMFTDTDANHSLYTSHQEPVEELIDFLSQYQVKKISRSKWEQNANNEKGFMFSITSGNKMFVATVFNDRLAQNNGNYYKVINGPIDMEWIENFYEKYINTK